MGDTPSVGTILTGGIQDISALLPLLGTEQCEEHVGSALSDGFLYAAASPMSIFGSLGVARAGFKTLIASISIPRWGFVGAEKLRDAGFRPSGKNLSLIMMDPANPERHRAETEIDLLLKKLQLEALDFMDLRRLTITLTLSKWNIAMLFSTAVACLLSITPYIHLNATRDNNRLDVFTRWAFPIVRALGGFLTVTSLQFLLQWRHLVILKKRLIFHAMNNGNKSILSSLQEMEPKFLWDLRMTSELCLSKLEQLVRLRIVAHHDVELGTKGPQRGALERLGTELHEANNVMFPTANFWRPLALQMLMVLGIVGSVVGYVGCFSVVQGVSGSLGPILWLLLEGILSIARMLFWSSNPSLDDLDHINLSFKTASHLPFSTCNKSEQEILDDKLLPLVRAPEFAKHIRPYTGFVEPVDDIDMTAFYTLTRKAAEGPGSSDRVLFITLVDKNQRAARVYWEDNKGTSHVLAAEPLIFQPMYSILHTRLLDLPPDRADFHITESILKTHYQSIVRMLQPRQSNSRILLDEWDMKWDLSNITPIGAVVSNGSHDPNDKVKLDRDDIGQFPQGVLQRKRERRSTNQQAWLESFMSEVESRTQREMVGWLDSRWWPDMNEIHGAHERPPLDALIMRHSALALERFGMEALLIHEIWTWESHLWRGFESWVGGVTASQGVGPYSEDLVKRLKKDWIRYTRARLDEDQATTAARLARAKSTFTATFPGESKLDMGVVRRLKEAWDELEKSVEHEWQILFDSCEAEEPFRTSRPGLPFQRSPPDASITTPPSGNRLVDYLDRYDKNAEEEFSGSTSQLIPLYNFWKKERERRFECEAKDVEGWFERGIAACDAALGSPGSSIMPYIVVHPTKWILITQDMVESEGIGPLSRSLQRNPYIQLIEFSGFRNDEELAYAIREIIPRTASSLTTIAMPVYTLQIGNHTISALAALVKENTGIRSILANLPSLDSLAAELANRESVAGHATTSYTFQGFRVVSGGSISPGYLSNGHSRVSESKIELRFPGPHHGVLKLVLHHHSGSETTLALRINDKAPLPVLVARSQNTQEYMLSPHEDYNPGAQNIIVVTPSSNAYKLYSIDLIDEDGMPLDNEAFGEDGRESQSGN